MASPQGNDVDWAVFQKQLDTAFHTKHDVYPAGTPEHAELLHFIQRLHRFRQQKKESATNTSSQHAKFLPDENCEAILLGVPSTYDARYRINNSFVFNPVKIRVAIREVGYLLKKLTHPPTDWTSDMIVNEYRSMLPWYEDFLQRKQVAKIKKLILDKSKLPMATYEDAIVSAVRSHQAVVIAGDTGCGKSTQVPQFLVKAGFKRVVCTQPRRISAMSLCRRVAHESLNVHGNEIAYKIRFTSTMTGGSRVVFMTEGILLRMMATDPQLSSFDVVIIDEVHERHLNTDFLLALLRAVLLQRPELRVVLMSATISFQAYSDYFGGAPVIQVPGRLYPIQLEYVAPEPQDAGLDANRSKSKSTVSSQVGHHHQSKLQQQPARGSGNKDRSQDAIDPKPYIKLLQCIDGEVPSSQRGDMLIFVAGMADIVALSEAIRAYAQESRRWLVLPLHSSLPVEEQDKVFDTVPDGVRKCIISTNIAETSVTIDGVRFVVDSGRAKEMIHDVASGAGSLQEGWISRASADQRKGRAGRTGPGKCYRMYSESEFEGFRPFSLPEVQRIRLESVVLQIKALAGSYMDPRQFGFIDPPTEDGLEAAVIALKQSGALTHNEELTPLGAVLSLLPVDIHVGKLLVLACMLQIVEPVLTIAAALSVQSPFSKLNDDDEKARSYRNQLISGDGDAFTLLHVFEEWLSVKATGKAPDAGSILDAEDGHNNGEGNMSSVNHDRNQEQNCRITGGRPHHHYSSGGRPHSHHYSSRNKSNKDKSGVVYINSSKWCKRAGIEEQRLYEMAKLRGQFQELLADVGLLRLAFAGNNHGDSQVQGGRTRGGTRAAAKKRLRELQQDQERKRGKRVLSMEDGQDNKDSSDERSSDEGDDDDGGGARQNAAAADDDDDVHDLDMRISVDVQSMHRATTVKLTRGDVLLLKFVLAASLYPRIAIPDPHNRQRRSQDCKFHTSTLPELVVHPGSSLSGAVAELSSQEVLLYTQLLETRRQYLCGLTPAWALPSLLLSACSLDTDDAATRWVVDGWLLIRVHNYEQQAVEDSCSNQEESDYGSKISESSAGLQLLKWVTSLRSRSSLLLHQRLCSARLNSLESVSVVDDGLSLRPWLAAASGNEWLRDQLMRIPDSTRKQLVQVAAQSAIVVSGNLKPAAGSTVEGGADGKLPINKDAFNNRNYLVLPDTLNSGAPPSYTVGELSHPADIAVVPQALTDALATAAWWGVDMTQEASWRCSTEFEDQLATDLALMMEAPFRYSVERLAGGLKTTSMYKLPVDVLSQRGDASIPQEEAGAAGCNNHVVESFICREGDNATKTSFLDRTTVTTSSYMIPVVTSTSLETHQTTGVYTTKASIMCRGESNNNQVVNPSVDHNGVPCHKAGVHPSVDHNGVPCHKAGVQLAPWLRWGSLQCFESQLTAHSMQPALRKHWICPAAGCGVKLIGTYEEIKAHLSSCERVLSQSPEILGSKGYKDASAHERVHKEDDQQLEEVLAARLHGSSVNASSGQLHSRTNTTTINCNIVDYFKKKVTWGRRQQTRFKAVHKSDCSGIYSAGDPLHDGEFEDNLGQKGQQGEEAKGCAPNGMQFRCPECGMCEILTPVQILQHKRSHSRGS
ncbi:hypothetical protein CEUSTIGMA_g11456.t1 [Chlamydomonas eustigma]|uniref:RNA helicase n=1 Tax=Chlamydomonas eustigma TaxID=1157962 RepID=A0A250XMA8_9CHLO|nr:hypothetical protein CEUSTIGMA_g11456.t1 [Chlamydomonas eustigma]|eukprot:GAX84032.1 hypothetical protein CEUSTIGMA_g11456.t1 [Chlamydomonas eustigma]